jgi:hypothetical protein
MVPWVRIRISIEIKKTGYRYGSTLITMEILNTIPGSVADPDP